MTSDNSKPTYDDFLYVDFEQAQEHIRHYDSQILNVFKFLATIYASIVGASVAILQHSILNNTDYTLSVKTLLFTAFLIGFFLNFSVVRYRLYFVKCARYINEFRELFLLHKPLGFENKSKMYCNPKYPSAYDLKSSHMVFHLSSVIASSLCLGCSFCVELGEPNFLQPWPIAVSVASVVVQLWVSRRHLNTLN